MFWSTDHHDTLKVHYLLETHKGQRYFFINKRKPEIKPSYKVKQATKSSS